MAAIIWLVMCGCFHSACLGGGWTATPTYLLTSTTWLSCKLPLCVRVWLHETNDVVGLHIDSENACRLCFTKLEQGSKAAVILQSLLRVSLVLKLSPVQFDWPARIPARYNCNCFWAKESQLKSPDGFSCGEHVTVWGQD